MHTAAKSVAPITPNRSPGRLESRVAAKASRYAIALLLVAIAAGISYPLRAHIYTTPLFFIAVIIAAWYGGAGPGALAMFASAALIHFFFQIPGPGSGIRDFARLAEFIFVGAVVTVAITAHRRSERSLRRAHDELEIKVQERTAEARRSEKEMRDVFETVPAMIWSTSPTGKVDFMNHAWQKYTGLPLENSLGWNWETVLHPDDQAVVAANWREAVNEGQASEWEVRMRRADGEYRWCFGRTVPLRNKSGEIIRWYGTAIDIEDRKRAEQALQKSEAYLSEGQRLTHTASFVWDVKTGTASHLSDEWYRIYGFGPGDEDAWKVREQLFHPEDRIKWQAAVDHAIRAKTDYELEYRLVFPDGLTKHVHVIGHPILNRSGEVMQFMGSVTDITERKRTEALLAGEKQLLEMIATGISLKEIAQTLCEVIEEQRPSTLASVLLMNPDGAHLDLIAGPKLPNDWIEQMQKLPIGPCAGSCGTAAYRGSQVIVSDIATDPLWDVPDHRAKALHHGLHASWSNPVLSSSGKVLGTFCMYYREPRSPTGQDLELIELATHLVRVAIERDHAQESIRKSEQLARSHVDVMMRSLDVLATEAAPEKFIGEMLRTIGQNLGALRVLLWLRDPKDDSLRLHLAMEKDRRIPPDPNHPLMKDPRSWRKLAFLQEMLFTKSPMVCDNIQEESRISPAFREYLESWGTKRFMTVPMFVTGELRGFIGIQHAEAGAYRADQIELAQALAHHVMLAVRDQELGDQQREAAILKERTRMARDIHDTLAQGFTGVVVQMEAAEEALLDEDHENVVRHVRRARELARESLAEARRSVHALRPQALEKAGFTDALKAIIENTAAGTPLRTEFQLDGKPRELTPDVEENLLHIGQEALTNALKHARATKFQTRLYFDSDAIRLELSDNGGGFVADRVNGDGFGLIGMKERADQIGATLNILSKPGEGTKIVAVSPYQHAPA